MFKMKKLLSTALLVVMVASMSLTALATETNHDVLGETLESDIQVYESLGIDTQALEILKIAENILNDSPDIDIDTLNNLIVKELASKSATLEVRAPSDYLPVDEGKLNDLEKEVFDSNPYYGAYALLDASTAMDFTSNVWNETYGFHNDNADAFRHSYWNGLMTFHTTDSYAKRFADAHEEGGVANPPLESEMDYFNNAKGREIIADKRYPNFPNQMMYLHAIKDDILEALEAGHMRRFVGDDIGNKNYLVSTNSVGEK